MKKMLVMAAALLLLVATMGQPRKKAAYRYRKDSSYTMKDSLGFYKNNDTTTKRKYKSMKRKTRTTRYKSDSTSILK